MRSFALPVLLALDLGLGGVLAALWLDEDFDPKHVTWREPAAVAPSTDSFKVFQVGALGNDAAQFAAITERPLFWAARRPPPPPQPEKGPDQEPDPFADIHLFGLIDSGDTGVAIVRAGGKVRRVKIGESVGEWVLEGMAGREVRFKGASGEVRSLQLKYVAQAARPAPAAGTPSASQAESGGGSGVGMVRSADGSMKTVEEAIAERRARREAARARAMATTGAAKK